MLSQESSYQASDGISNKKVLSFASFPSHLQSQSWTSFKFSLFFSFLISSTLHTLLSFFSSLYRPLHHTFPSAVPSIFAAKNTKSRPGSLRPTAHGSPCPLNPRHHGTTPTPILASDICTRCRAYTVEPTIGQDSGSFVWLCEMFFS